ncbi:hypothetical protein [Sinomonas terrae]|uniref:Uncharacterized protein n=1 Tax=Sinomonas terrae TaxID=2908838 RepID=A0ABS9U2Q3_9MICC|nr:hypothetical protein [Sinomonas terrae]MCH6470979.1 hypothetical protein [Sinomonas terrae]
MGAGARRALSDLYSSGSRGGGIVVLSAVALGLLLAAIALGLMIPWFAAGVVAQTAKMQLSSVVKLDAPP